MRGSVVLHARALDSMIFGVDGVIGATDPLKPDLTLNPNQCPFVAAAILALHIHQPLLRLLA